MIGRRGLLALALLCGAVLTPRAWCAPAKTPWLILAYLDGRGGLGGAVSLYEAQLRSAFNRHGFAVALQVLGDERSPANSAKRVLLRPGQAAVIAAVPAAASPADALADFIVWASRAQSAERHALLIMGHGAGLLDGQRALTPGALRPPLMCAGLRQASQRAAPPLDVVCLDTCYGATIEVLYGLQGLCQYVTAAPGLIFSPGLDWAGALSDLAHDPAPAALVRGLVSRGMARSESRLALVGVDETQLGSVCARTGELASLLQDNLAVEMTTLTWVRAHTLSWGDRSELADLGSLASNLQLNAATPAVREVAAKVVEALGRTVIATWGNEGAEGSGAVGVYFPPTLAEVPPDYRTAYEFAAAWNWAALLESYWTRTKQLLTTTTP